ncbi:MAG: TolB family protein [Vicinamibacterales bacterium]
MIWRAATALLVALFVLAAVPAVRHLREQPPPAPPAVRASFLAPPGASLTIGAATLDAALSPDGRTVVFAAVSDGRVTLWQQPLDGRAERIPGTEGAAHPAWKASGGVIAFAAGGVIRQVALSNFERRDLVAAPTPAGLAWLTDGSLVFAPTGNGPLVRLQNGARSDATRLRDGDRAHVWPAVADDGFTYLALREDGRHVIRWRRHDMDVELGRASGHGQLVGDSLVFSRDGVLLAQRIDRERGAPAGRAVPLLPGVGESQGRTAFAASARVILAGLPHAGNQELYWVDTAGVRRGTIVEPGDLWQVRVSPQGDYAALTAFDPLLRTLDVFAVPLSSPADARRVSLSLGADSDPVWAPRGGELLFRSDSAGNARLLSRRVSPTEAQERLVDTPLVGATPTDWRADQVLLSARGANGRRDIWMLDLATGEPRQLTSGGFNEWDAAWAPRGDAFAYVSDEGGAANVYVEPFPPTGARVRVSFAGGQRPQWRDNGRSLLFMRQDEIVRAERRDDGFSFTTPQTVIRVDRLIDFSVRQTTEDMAILAGLLRADQAAASIVDWATLATGR